MAATEPKPESPPLELPRENLVRGIFPADLEIRDSTETTPPTLYGHFAKFNEWTEIKSAYEGHFMERIAPGAFKKTFRESKPKILFQHGNDPQLGDQILDRLRRAQIDGHRLPAALEHRRRMISLS